MNEPRLQAKTLTTSRIGPRIRLSPISPQMRVLVNFLTAFWRQCAQGDAKNVARKCFRATLTLHFRDQAWANGTATKVWASPRWISSKTDFLPDLAASATARLAS